MFRCMVEHLVNRINKVDRLGLHLPYRPNKKQQSILEHVNLQFPKIWLFVFDNMCHKYNKWHMCIYNTVLHI